MPSTQTITLACALYAIECIAAIKTTWSSLRPQVTPGRDGRIHGANRADTFVVRDTEGYREHQGSIFTGTVLQDTSTKHFHAVVLVESKWGDSPSIHTADLTAAYDRIHPLPVGRPNVYRGTTFQLNPFWQNQRKPRSGSQLEWAIDQLLEGDIAAQTFYDAGIKARVMQDLLDGRYATLIVDEISVNDQDEQDEEKDDDQDQQEETSVDDDQDQDEPEETIVDDDQDQDEPEETVDDDEIPIEDDDQEEASIDDDQDQHQDNQQVFPQEYQLLRTLARARQNIMLVGPSGSGKTYICHELAKDLGMEFGSVSCSEGMSESQLSGLLIPADNGSMKFLDSHFVRLYEQGGIFLFDEIDASDPNTLTFINAALAGNSFYLPLREGSPMVQRHPDFVCVAAANTVGDGATGIYSGRSQLDGATLDRFRAGMISWDYCEQVERSLTCSDIYYWAIAIRRFINENDLPYLMSTRVMRDFSIQYEKFGITMAQIERSYFMSWSKEDIGVYRKWIRS